MVRQGRHRGKTRQLYAVEHPNVTRSKIRSSGDRERTTSPRGGKRCNASLTGRIAPLGGRDKGKPAERWGRKANGATAREGRVPRRLSRRTDLKEEHHVLDLSDRESVAARERSDDRCLRGRRGYGTDRRRWPDHRT